MQYRQAVTKDIHRGGEIRLECMIAAKGLDNKTLDVGDPLDDESLKVHCTLDDVAAIAD